MAVLILFSIAGLVALVSGLLMILHRNPVISALYLALCFCAVALLFLLLGAQFVAVVQVILYAGAVMVFFLFVIMLLNLRKKEEGEERRKVQKWVSIYFAVIFALIVLYIFIAAAGAPVPASAKEAMGTLQPQGNTEAVATLLFTTYLFPFEAASILLLAAMVGAVVLAKRYFR
jgi:NADH-quinone oxidoreductase subunit J